MGALCYQTCEDEDIIEIVNLCEDADNVIEVKADRFAFIKCSSTLVSMTDSAEWAALRADDKIIRTPQLSEFELPLPELVKVKLKECSNVESVIAKMQKVPIDTILLDTATKTDEDFVCDFYKKIQNYAMILGLCGNTILYNKSWATTENPGFGGLVGNVDYTTKVIGNKKYLAIKGELEFDITHQCWARLSVTKAVYDAIFN